MKPLIERRRYPRHEVLAGSLLSDRDYLIGFGRIVNFSRCGARCFSLSEVCSRDEKVDNVELYIPSLGLELQGLSVKIIELTQHMLAFTTTETGICTDFSIEFTGDCLSRIPDFSTEEVS